MQAEHCVGIKCNTMKKLLGWKHLISCEHSFNPYQNNQQTSDTNDKPTTGHN